MDMKPLLYKYAIAILFLTLPAICFGQQKQINILEKGANPDGITFNTGIIQGAIDEAALSGHGKVIIPAGKFLTGVIHLKSNVELHLEQDAYLLGSTRRLDYGLPNASPLIVVENQKNIAITGKGTIDGQAEELLKDLNEQLKLGTIEDKEWQEYNPWHQMRPEERNRPMILRVFQCDSIKVTGVTIKNASCWVQDFRNSSNIVIDSINVESNVFWNNDGIDLTDCVNAKVTNCNINADDDGICLKSSTRGLSCKNILVANCKVRSSASAIKFGTASWGGFQDITVSDIKVYDTYRSAIAIECVDGGILRGVEVSNIDAVNTGNAIFVRLGHRNKDSVYSTLENVYIHDIRVEVPKGKPDEGYPMEGPLVKIPHNVYPSSISGIPGHPVKNVRLENIKIIYEGGADKQTACFPIDSLSKIPEQIPNYPEFSMFGELPAWGFYVRHAEGIGFSDIKLQFKQEDFRAASIFDDVKGLKLQNINIPSVKEYPMLILNNVKGEKLKQLKLADNKSQAILRK